MAKVSLKGVKKIYEKNIVAVKDFNLEIGDKEFVVLVGPSGCGKSTTLRMVAGLEEISEGELYIGDRMVNDVAPKDRDIAMVFQNYALYPHMSVFDNMAFALKLRKVPREEIKKRVEQAAEILGITELLQRKPKALSGGQRQRVAIGRAIVREPQVFLMDEPLSNLDAKLRNQMRTEIIKLRQRIDTTFIYVTHDQVEAMTLGDRIVVMEDGFIRQIGCPQDVFSKPANMFVAGFIGTPQMNFFDAALELHDGVYSVVLHNIRIKLPEDKQNAFKAKKLGAQTCILGVRPEHISIVHEAGENCMEAMIDVAEMMGNETYLHINIDGKDVVIRVPTIDLPERYRCGHQNASTVHFIFPTELVHLFNAETKENLLNE